MQKQNACVLQICRFRALEISNPDSALLERLMVIKRLWISYGKNRDIQKHILVNGIHMTRIHLYRQW